MTKEQLLELKEKLSKLSEEELRLRDLYLMKLAKGEIEGPQVGYPSIDKPWLKNYRKEAITDVYPSETLYEHILDRNKNNLNSYALNYFGKRVKYREMFKKIDELAASFSSLGVKKGDIVSFCVATTPETIYSFYALNKIGAIINTIDLSTNNEFIVDRINTTNSKIVIALDSVVEKMSPILDRLNVETIVNLSPTNSLPAIDFLRNLKSEKNSLNKVDKRIIDWKEFIKKGNQKVETCPNEKDMPALIVYTGGTTGVPKGAVLSNDGINSTIRQLKETGIHSDLGDRYLDIMPPFIAYGVVCGIHNPLSERQEIVIIPKLDAKKFPEYIKKYKPNHVIGVPALFETMTKSELLKNADLSFLKNMICGGDKLTLSSEKLINDFLANHGSRAKVAQGFGMTEVGTSVTYTINNNQTQNHIGCPLPKANFQIVKVGTNEELSYNEKGEICISTPSLMLSYYKNEKENEKMLKKHEDGKIWIHSQDLGYMDQNGELYFIDRFKRMIVRHDGHNVWPDAIEQIISSHYAVDCCVVIGIKTAENTNGSIPTALIVLKDDYKKDSERIIEEIDKRCKEMLPGRDIAQDYLIRDSLPKTTAGKIDFNSVQEDENQKRRVLIKNN